MTQVTPLDALIGAGGTLLGALVGKWSSWRVQQKRKWLVQDEILGHRGVDGVPDKLSMADRMALQDIAIRDIQKELHPNGGQSMHDAVMETRRNTEQAAFEATRVRERLAEHEAKESDYRHKQANAMQAHINDDYERQGKLTEAITEIAVSLAKKQGSE